jgi:hypothetical protein
MIFFTSDQKEEEMDHHINEKWVSSLIMGCDIYVATP